MKIAAWNIVAGRTSTGGTPNPAVVQNLAILAKTGVEIADAPVRTAASGRGSARPWRSSSPPPPSSRTHTREFIANSLRLLRFVDLGASCASFAIPTSPDYVADHLPLVARFRVNKKDDD